MLIDLAKENGDLSRLHSTGDLFSQIIDPWLIRDGTDAVLSNDIRLKCMQAIAVHALGGGGRPLTYRAINEYCDPILQPVSAKERDEFNSDIRNCGVLRRLAKDEFEFQHALFYEYCIARTVFEDVKNVDFDVFGMYPFTNEVVDFIVELTRKSNYTSQVREVVSEVWKEDISSTARANLLRVHCALGGDCGGFDFRNIVTRFPTPRFLVESSTIDTVRMA